MNLLQTLLKEANAQSADRTKIHIAVKDKGSQKSCANYL